MGCMDCTELNWAAPSRGVVWGLKAKVGQHVCREDAIVGTNVSGEKTSWVII